MSQQRLPGLVAGEGTARRGRRPHGYTKQDYGQMQVFKYQQKTSPAVLTGVAVEVPIACACSYLPYPHLLRGLEWDRHKAGALRPLDWRERERGF